MAIRASVISIMEITRSKKPVKRLIFTKRPSLRLPASFAHSSQGQLSMSGSFMTSRQLSRSSRKGLPGRTMEPCTCGTYSHSMPNMSLPPYISGVNLLEPVTMPRATLSGTQ